MTGYFSALGFVIALASPAALLADDAEIHTFHCLHGCPSGTPATNDLVVREIYTLSSNDLTKFSDWVAYRVTRQTIGSGESRRWRRDPWLGGGETLPPAAYDGASAALDIDRGHQAPLAALSAPPHAQDTNILSNITPQRKGLNQSSWMFLEGRERKLAQDGDKIRRGRPAAIAASLPGRIATSPKGAPATVDRGACVETRSLADALPLEQGGGKRSEHGRRGCGRGRSLGPA